jgi:hypothetical protein
MPKVVSLSFAQPEGFGHLSATEYAAMVLERGSVAEVAAAAERRQTGAAVLGRRNVLAHRWSERPGNRERRRQLVRRLQPTASGAASRPCSATVPSATPMPMHGNASL